MPPCLRVGVPTPEKPWLLAPTEVSLPRMRRTREGGASPLRTRFLLEACLRPAPRSWEHLRKRVPLLGNPPLEIPIRMMPRDPRVPLLDSPPVTILIFRGSRDETPLLQMLEIPQGWADLSQENPPLPFLEAPIQVLHHQIGLGVRPREDRRAWVVLGNPIWATPCRVVPIGVNPPRWLMRGNPTSRCVHWGRWRKLPKLLCRC